LCGACFPVLLRCSFDWIGRSALVNYWLALWLSSSTMQIRRHMYSGYFDFITLFVGMTTPFYAIKLDVVNLLLDLFFLFLATLNLYLNLMYSTNFNERISFILVKKTKNKNGSIIDQGCAWNCWTWNLVR
jgi:hypothetical protein